VSAIRTTRASAAEPRKAKPRVCILAETFHPVIGGCESQARLLADRLVGGGHAVTVLTRRSVAELPRDDRLGPIRVHRLDPGGPGGNKRWPMVAIAARELWRRRDTFDVVLVLGFRALGLAAMAVRRAAGLPCVLKAESNGEMSGEFFRGGLQRLRLAPGDPGVRHLLGARNRVLRRADAFVAISAEIERELLAAGVPTARVHRIPNGVDTDLFRPATRRERAAIRGSLGLPAEGCWVTFTGRLVAYKGLPLLLRVWREIAAVVPEARLLLVGEGSGDIANCEAELRAFVTDHGLADRVSFTGPVRDVHRFLQASDVFAFPTENEAFGLSLVEAMACGLPCVASPVGGVPDIVSDGRDGLLVADANARAWRDTLLWMLRDADRRRALGEAARRTAVQRFSVDSVAAAYAKLLDAHSRPHVPRAASGSRGRRRAPTPLRLSSGRTDLPLSRTQ
jgi:glycosyltransferase involved in cell wall biosynthesis